MIATTASIAAAAGLAGSVAAQTPATSPVAGGTRTVDIHVRRLRAKMGAVAGGLIETVRNVGYKLRGNR